MNRTPLWSPSKEQIAASRLTEFSAFVEQRTEKNFSDYGELHSWSCEPGGEFWNVLWDYSDIVGDKGDRVVTLEDKMPGASYFPSGSLNYAENLHPLESQIQTP